MFLEEEEQDINLMNKIFWKDTLFSFSPLFKIRARSAGAPILAGGVTVTFPDIPFTTDARE